jgi:hypothetical protein
MSTAQSTNRSSGRKLTPEEQVRRQVRTQMLDYYLAIDRDGHFLHPPGHSVKDLPKGDPERIKAEDDELHEFIDLAFDIKVPRKVVEPGHRAPFDFVADLFYERVKNALGFANRSGGKALALETPILTTEGWKTMGTIEVGDFVFAPDGSRVDVVSTSEVMEDHVCYEVRFWSGEKLVADAEHLWEVTRSKKSYTEILTTQQIYDRMQDPPRIGMTTLHWIQHTKPLDYQAQELLIPPYVLGAWLGDGSSYHEVIFSWDQEIVDRITTLWPEPVRDDSTERTKAYFLPGFRRALRKIGLLESCTGTPKAEKRIPKAYLESSFDQRVELLRGLMDTDGQFRGGKSVAEFNTTTPQLAYDVHQLVSSLGLVASIYKGEAWCHKPNGERVRGKDSYSIAFRPMHDWSPFHFSRKKDGIKKAVRRLSHRVHSIKPVDSVPVRCIGVNHPQHLYLAGRSLIPTHNTINTAILNFLDMLFKHPCEVASAGAVLDQANKCYRYFRGFLRKPWFKRFNEHYHLITGKGFLGKDIQSWTVFANGSTMEIITGTDKGLRSPHPHKARIDEIDLMPWETLQVGLSMARSSDGIRGQNVFTSTRQNARGSMQRLLDEAEAKGIDIYEWNIWEAVERCTRICVQDPEYGTCPIYGFCRGKAHRCDGFYKIDDFIDKVRLIDRETWETEWLNQRPSKHKLVYNIFDNARHVMTPQRLRKLSGVDYPSHHWWRVGGLDFGSGPGHPFVYLKLCQIPSGPWLVFFEYYAEQRLLRDHAQVIKSSPYYNGGEPIFADWAAQERLELRKEHRITTRQAVKDVLTGIDFVRTLFAGFPPLFTPGLYVWHECTNLISELGQYRWPVRPDGTVDRSGLPMKQWDHGPDALRYALFSSRSQTSVKYTARTIAGI